jgi:hypothetical protein
VALCHEKRILKMSEMTTPDTDRPQDEMSSDSDETEKAPDGNEDANPALEKAPNPDGDPDDDRMGAPAVMPD